LCDSAAIEAFKAKAHDGPSIRADVFVRCCHSCDMAWQFPRGRTAEQSAASLTSSYAAAQQDTYFDPRRRAAVVESEFAFMDALFDTPGTLLDIGAGDGAFIAHAASCGWDCVGVDPAASPSEAMTAATGRVRLIRGVLDDLPSGQRFDAVTLWDVIEHADDPEALLEAAAARLAPDGVLVIETGNYQSVDRASAGADWWGYALDHRWYFGPPAVRELLMRAGMTHAALASRVLRPWWTGRRVPTPPSHAALAKSMVRHPARAPESWRRFREMQRAARTWPEWGGLGIVTVAASRRPLARTHAREALVALD
jgi:2-polyprenyl-3-methyl-5-hydroxy-6-metoxy-1,4-benzoquinol methylase